jgi:hypothetical protein
MFSWLSRLRGERDPIQLARAAFDREHPGSSSWGAMVAADDSERKIVFVFHGDTKPPQVERYVVRKRATDAERLDPDGGY